VQHLLSGRDCCGLANESIPVFLNPVGEMRDEKNLKLEDTLVILLVSLSPVMLGTMWKAQSGLLPAR